jgi:hypothetical protein
MATLDQQSNSKKLARSPTFRIGALVAGYIFTCWLVRLVFITIVTYFFLQNRTPLQDVGDVIRANYITTYGIAAALYITVLQFLYPLTITNWREVLPTKKAKATYPTGMVAGMVVAASLLFGTTLGGHYQFLGSYIKFDEIAISAGSVFVFALSLLSITLVEEFIFRGKAEPHLRILFQKEKLPPKLREPATVVAMAIVYVFIKDLQFTLEPMEALNMGLLSACLSKVRKETGSYVSAAGFAAGMYIVMHAICSLPLFGQDISGIILVRAPDEKGISSLLSGGEHGPENGLALTVLLTIYALQQKLKLRSFGLDRP